MRQGLMRPSAPAGLLRRDDLFVLKIPLIPTAARESRRLALAACKELKMAHKKIERKKELDRRRKRRAERLKLRAKEARSGMTA